MTPIQLFNIPSYKIDTASFSNLLHDKVVGEFEQAFAKYVGAKYAVSFNSATSAIFLLLREGFINRHIYVPSLIPPVVLNAVINSGNKIKFTDNVDWIGNAYTLVENTHWKIIDSAQHVSHNQYRKIPGKKTGTFIIYSFYPTKPIGSCDGGMIVSDNKEMIDKLRAATMNGMSGEINNWERTQVSIGHKMYMNAIQAKIGMENLQHLDAKKKALAAVRAMYNGFLHEGRPPSDHLYRIEVSDRDGFIAKAKKEGITCGIHYRAAHLNPVFKNDTVGSFVRSVLTADSFVSLPFHEMLTPKDCDRVVMFTKKNR